MRIKVACIALLAFAVAAAAQTPCTAAQSSLFAMASSRHVRTLRKAAAAAGSGYTVKLVYAEKMFALRPGLETARALLQVLPRDDKEQQSVMTLSDSRCTYETGAQMLALEHVTDRIDREWASAVLMDRSFMERYIRASFLLTLDPHSHYAEAMRRVCRLAPAEFSRAVRVLALSDQKRFGKYVFSLKGCRPIAIGEE